MGFEVRIYSMKQLKQLMDSGKIAGCKKCKSIFEDDDKAFTLETGKCPYCHKVFDTPITI